MKQYELANLPISIGIGNVLEVISDRKWGVDDGVYNLTTGAKTSSTADGQTDYYVAYILTYSDYDPYGTIQDGRKKTVNDYRYGYQGSERDDELKGEGNSYTTEYRLLDPRIGRWLSIDPLTAQMPWFSPYNAMDNNPILLNDPNGLKATDWVARDWTDENGVKHHKWEWTPASFNNIDEAKAAGWDHWMGRSGIIENMHTPSGYVGPVTLLNNGTYEERIMLRGGYENDEYTVKPTIIDLTQNSQGWEVNPTVEETKGMEVIPVLMEQKGITDWWQRQRIADIRLKAIFRMCDNLAAGAMAILCAPLALELAPAAGTTLMNAARAYHFTFGVNGGYVNMAWNAGGQLTQAVADPQNYKADFLSIGMSGFIRTPTALSGGTPLLHQAAIGVSSSYLQVTTNGIETKGPLNSYATATSINNMIGNSYSNSMYGSNGAALIINNGFIQPIINNFEQLSRKKR